MPFDLIVLSRVEKILNQPGEMAESKETSLNRDEEERMLQNPAKEQIVPNTAYQFTPIVEKKKTFLDTLLDLFGSSSSKNEGKASVAKKKKITLLGELSS